MSLYGVNGKEPIAAWIPSRDDTGNGTTTLNDLVGSNNGTLTNMDAASGWVADTDAGGVRALDFDGVNDFVTMGSPASLRLNSTVTVSAWVLPRSTSQLGIAVHGSGAQVYFGLVFSAASNQKLSFWNSGSAAITAPSTSALNQWHHFVGVRSASGLELFVDGHSVATAAGSTGTGIASNLMVLGQFGSFAGYKSSSRKDDIRIWDQALNATDASDLYAAQRGGITNPPLAQYFTGIRSYNRRRKVGT